MVHYKSLNTERSETRVVALAPGTSKDELLSCTIRTISLDENSSFEALSYVWGDASITKLIHVNGEQLSATANLDAALRASRLPCKPRTLWVEAICINQQDIAEKNVQVPRMDKIYSGASPVIVWLGPSSPDIELALSWTQAYVAKSKSSATWYWR
ncbi:heterokaryon incompatibility protein-domain-containing protein [Xylariaceae sp. FL0255]|nr:heterokaryon incompatibility protein-domain-containing protein [Xylariaceae sp. FL0255]